jgi:hypothetical protein
MHWDRSLLGLFEDLEQQAQGLHLLERDAEVAERSRAEYAQVEMASRVHASVGAQVVLGLVGVGTVEGLLVRAGADWCLVQTGNEREWVVRVAAVRSARGLSPRAVSEAARPVVGRLGFGSVLRGMAEAKAPLVVHHLDGSQTRGRLGRIGADFAEVIPSAEDRDRAGEPVVLPFAQVAGVRPA